MRFAIIFFLAGLVASAPATLQAREDCPAGAYGALCPGNAPADAVCCDTRGVGHCDGPGRLYNVCKVE
ncbi:hypothetical protein DBV05_g7890 [Lasiodiplodia theobromae]|uniref:Uncharacterized protein n=1 Tax=Lasiodiplodia theobromae TaxID=45133 RepID=A0A5N5D790_9PEZI|nr:hypothetical protein DBV05_g7890 [Lasiodiplodia theobromae]